MRRTKAFTVDLPPSNFAVGLDDGRGILSLQTSICKDLLVHPHGQDGRFTAGAERGPREPGTIYQHCKTYGT